MLVVDDEKALVTLLRYNLEREGFGVIDAGDGWGAIALVKERRPDLILLDWMLPAISGIEVSRQIRRTPDCRGTPIIMLTGRSEEADKLLGFEVGVDDYITKPFSPAEVIARCRAVLRRSEPGSISKVICYDDLSVD